MPEDPKILKLMSDLSTLKFDVRSIGDKVRGKFGANVSGITLDFAILKVHVNPVDTEIKVAKEIVIRMRPQRVFSKKECCDDCIDSAIKALLRIKEILTDKQEKLVDFTNGPLFECIDFMLVAINQFLTYHQKLDSQLRSVPDAPSSLWRPGPEREKYMNALELLREHLYRSMLNISAIAGMSFSKEEIIVYEGEWSMENYTL